ncbi:MAG: polynucleotide adenylyltransferase PcnB [Pseudomonadota bacterium]
MTNIRLQTQKLSPAVYAKSQHPLRREHIPKHVVQIIEKLNAAKYEGYVVGGCVRDKLFGMAPKDFDVVTDARPEQIKQLFKNCRLIGRRFRLAHLRYGREIVEVATFRGHHVESSPDSQTCDSGMLMRDNVYGCIEEDAARRDFEMNAMYFNPITEEILDFANGLQAVNKRKIKMIGIAQNRIAEDPVRMLRAVRFSAKLGCNLHEELQDAIKRQAQLISNVAPARLFEEINKLLISGRGQATLPLLIEFGLMQHLFPLWVNPVDSHSSKEWQIIDKMLANTDERLKNNLKITPAFLYATVLWYHIEDYALRLSQEGGLNYFDALNIASIDMLQVQLKRVMIPKRFTIVMREIWSFQYRLNNRSGRRPFQMMTHPRFRAAYDFLLLRAFVEGGELHDIAEWWTQFQTASNTDKKSMLLPQKNKRKRRNKRRST